MADSNISLTDPVASSSKSNTPENNTNLHEMDTQIPYPTANESSESIYCADTQLPMENNSPSFHSMDTQLPVPDYLLNERKISDKHDMKLDRFGANKENENSLYNAETQIPTEYENTNTLNKANVTDNEGVESRLPNLEDRHLSSECKQSDNDIFTAATQLPDSETETILTAPTQLPTFDNADTEQPTIVNQRMSGELREKTKDNFGEGDRSKDHILFDEVDNQSFLEVFDSQSLLPHEDAPEDENVIIPLSQVSQEDENDIIKPNSLALKRSNRIDSDSTDCDDLDVLQTQNIPVKPTDDDLTDCEDDIDLEPNKLRDSEPKTINLEDIATQCIVKNVAHRSSILKFEDIATQIIEDYVELNNDTTSKSAFKTSDDKLAHKNLVLNFEDMATQVIGDDVEIKMHNELEFADKTPKETISDDIATQVIPGKNETDFEDLATQIIPEVPLEKIDCSNTANNQYSEEIIYTFKVPYSTPLKTKKKDTPKSTDNKYVIALPKSPIKIVNLANDEQYYAATQELYDDLCSQRESSPEFVRPQARKMINNSLLKEKQIEIINLDDKAVPSTVESYELVKLKHIESETAPKTKYVEADKSSETSDGDERINKFVSSLSTKMIREVIGVDKEVTNIKRVPSDLSDVEVTPKKVRPFKFIETELPSSQEIKTSISMTCKTLAPESSSDSEPERNTTPIVFRKKKIIKQAKIDLMKKFQEPALPTRVITRVRKPTSKIQDSDEDTKKLSKNIMKLKTLPDFDNVNKEIMPENICGLKTKTENDNNKNITINLTKSTVVKKQSKARKNVTAIKKIDEAKDIRDKQEHEKLANKLKMKNLTTKKGDENNSKTISTENNESVMPTEENSRSSRSTRRTKEKEISEKEDVESLSIKKDSIRRTRHRDTDRNVRSTGSENNEDIVLLLETRNTRRKPKDDIISKNLDDSTKELKKKRGRPRKTDNKDHDIDTTTEKVDISKQTDNRRSKRQRTAKVFETKQNDKNSKNKSLKDQSTVYSISSESSLESPRPLKRSAGDNDAPNPKRTRSAISSNTCTVVSLNTSSIVNHSALGSTAARVKTHYVLFTAFPYEEVKTKLEALGKL